MKVYRNIYFQNSSIIAGNGQETLYYSGKIFNNAIAIKNFSAIFDATQDLLISCTSCAKKRYGRLVKV